MSTKRKKRTELTIEDKIEVIKLIEKKIGYRDIAREFDVSKTQIANIWKNKDAIKSQNEKYVPKNRKRLKYASKLEDVNNLTKEWYDTAKERNLPVSGPILQEKAREFAKEKGVEDFHASNGWLEAFKNNYGINFTRNHEYVVLPAVMNLKKMNL